MKKSQVQERRNTLGADVASLDDSRTVRAALSSEAPVARPFGTEILEHSERAIDLTRSVDSGLPLLVNHNDAALPIGRVRGISLDKDGVLRGDLHFSEGSQESRDAMALVRDGTLTDVSIRYRINDYDVRGETGAEEYHVTDWSLLEASVVSVPADATVGIGRQMELEGVTMPQDNDAPATAPVPNHTNSRRAGMQEGARAERDRISAIRSVAGQFKDNAAVQDLGEEAIAEGHTVDTFRSQLVDVLAGTPATPLGAPVAQPQHVSRSIQGGTTSGEKMTAGIREAFDIKAGNITGEKARELGAQNPWAGLSMIEVARQCLDSNGINTRGMSPLDVAGQVLGRYIDPGTANLDTTDFPAILEDVINKALFAGFDEAPVIWSQFCGTDSAGDFKAGTRPGLSQFTSLEVVAENGAITDGIVNDKKESFQIATYAKKFSVTRQTLVNDDLAALASIASRMGQAAGRTVDEQVMAFIEANGLMTEDSTALFDLATHNNLQAGAIDTTGIGLARTVMAQQTDSNGVILGIVPQYMLVPIELEQTMLELSTFNSDPTRVRRDNVYRTMWEPLASARLTDANDWYMFGKRGDCINVVFLNGQQSPMMARDEGWSTLAAHWRVVLDFTVMAVDWRAAIKFANA